MADLTGQSLPVILRLVEFACASEISGQAIGKPFDNVGFARSGDREYPDGVLKGGDGRSIDAVVRWRAGGATVVLLVGLDGGAMNGPDEIRVADHWTGHYAPNRCHQTAVAK